MKVLYLRYFTASNNWLNLNNIAVMGSESSSCFKSTVFTGTFLFNVAFRVA